MAGLPRFCTPYQSPPLPTAGGKSEFPHTYTNTPPHARPHAYTYLHKLTQTHPALRLLHHYSFSFLLKFSILFFFFSSLITFPVLFCSRQAALSYCSRGGWGPATFHQHLPAYLSTLSAWGERHVGWSSSLLCSTAQWREDAAGCQQTNMCKPRLRNMSLLMRRKALWLLGFSVQFPFSFFSHINNKVHPFSCFSSEKNYCTFWTFLAPHKAFNCLLTIVILINYFNQFIDNKIFNVSHR